MNKTILSAAGICLILIMFLAAFAGCTVPSVPASPQPQEPPPPAVAEKPPAEKPVSYVEVASFHTERRCGTCIYIEQRTQYNVETFFPEQLDDGTLVFNTWELGLKETEDVATRYQVVGSQLFINTIIDGTDHIEHIEAVWDREYLDDQEKFDALIQDLVTEALGAVE